MTARATDLSKFFKIKPQKFKIKLHGSVPRQHQIKSINDAHDLLRHCFDKLSWREQVLLFPLNSQHHVLGVYKIADGSNNDCRFDNRTIFQVLLLANANGFIIAHNHPSQNPEPSETDKKITQELNKISKLVGFRLVDHFIVTENHIKSVMHG